MRAGACKLAADISLAAFFELVEHNLRRCLLVKIGSFAECIIFYRQLFAPGGYSGIIFRSLLFIMSRYSKR